ncbi:MAG TPA: hypothetical protein VET48_07085 [Steroidobacteraceae bacterium]|nr:hypothetical protein [Steroidobacteraceae bacterium]
MSRGINQKTLRRDPASQAVVSVDDAGLAAYRAKQQKETALEQAFRYKNSMKHRLDVLEAAFKRFEKKG